MKHTPTSWIRRLGASALLAAGCVANAQDAPAGHWIGTWATAPQAAFPGPQARYAGQTLRLVVHTSLGGQRVRIHLSNLYGQVPLHIAGAHVARRTRAADIDAATDRALTFGGQRAITIAPGASVTSDAVALEVPALSDLAVSLYAKEPVAASTTHALAQQTGYASRAHVDATGAARFPKSRTLGDWPFLTGVDVDAPDGGSAIVAFGDSLIDGDGSSPDANARFGDALAARLQRAGGACARVAVLNEGLIGNRLLHDSPAQHAPKAPDFGRALGESALARFDRDVLGQAGVGAVIIHAGTNDLGFDGGVAPAGEAVSAPAIIDGYRQLVARAHAAGLRAIGSTLTPVEGVTALPGYDTPAKDVVRQQVNEWIRQGGAFDAVIDFDDVVRDPGHPARLSKRLAADDHLHPNDAGYAAIAAAVPLSMCERLPAH